MKKSVLVLVALGALLGAARHAPAQTPSDELEKSWNNACNTDSGQPRPGEFFQRCAEIFFTGNGTQARQHAAAVGNNLGILAAQGRVGRDEEERLLTLDIHSWNVFLTATSNWMDRGESAFESGFTSNAQGVLLGSDYLLSDRSLLGLALSYSSTNADFAGGAGDQKTHIFSVTTYGTQALTDDLAFDTYLSLGWGSIESVREIDYDLVLFEGDPSETTLHIEGTAQGETDGLQVGAGAGLGLGLHWGRLAFDPRLRMDYLDKQINPFAESDDVGLAMSYGEQAVRSLTVLLGSDVSLNIERTWGTLIPQVGAEYIHEFEDDVREITASFVDDVDGYLLSFQTESPDRDYFLLSIGLAAVMRQGLGVFAEFDAIAGHRFLDEETLIVGFRTEM